MDDILAPFFFLQSVLFVYWLYLLVKGRERPRKKCSWYPSVTVIIPAYNEEKNIASAIESVKRSDYPNLDIVVVDDGSTDRTPEVAQLLGAKVIRTHHVGKAEAINTALPHVRSDVVVILDADTVVEESSIRNLITPLCDENVVISVGMMEADGGGLLAGFQKIEYAFVSELLRAHSRNNKPLPFFFGAFMAVKKEFLDEVGGFPSDTPGEDFDLFVEAMERGKRIAGSDARARTKVPESLLSLVEQRIRWGKSGILIAWKHRRIIHRYPLFLYPYWPLYGLLGFPNLMVMFVRYLEWHSSHGTLLEYLLSWFTYYGPISSLLRLPEWGFPPLTVLGVLLGMLSFLVIGWSWKKNRGGMEDLPYLFVLPIYGTFLMGFILFLIYPYTFFTLKERKFIR